MADILDSPLDELELDLDRLKQLLSLVSSLREFAALAAPPEAPAESFEAKAASVGSEVRGLSADLPVLSGTLLLYLAGRFEHFVRMSFQAHSDAIAAKCERFEQLPPSMQKSLKLFTAQIVVSPTRYGFDEVAATAGIVDLASNLSPTKNLGKINSACIAVTESNMHSGMLAELYKRLGISAIWQDISKQAPLKTFLEIANDGDAEKEAKARLEGLMTTRNQVAHPNGAPTFPGPEKVIAWVEFIAVVSQTLTSVSRAHIAAFKPVT